MPLPPLLRRGAVALPRGAVLVVGLLAAGCASPHGWVDEAFYVRTSGADLYVHMRGDSRGGDAVLLLQGDEGAGSAPYRDSTAAELLEDDVVMVYFDQRGTGASTSRNTDDISLVQLQDDVLLMLDVIDAQWTATPTARVHLMGHSWGGLLGLSTLLDTEISERLAGWIEVGGVHDVPATYAASRALALAEASAQAGKGDHGDAWTDIRDRLKQTPAALGGVASLVEEQELARDAEALMDTIAGDAQVSGQGRQAAPGSPLNWAGANRRAATQALGEVVDLELDDELLTLTLPTLMIWGAHDLASPVAQAEQSVHRIGSEVVELTVLGRSGHAPMFSQPDGFADAVLTFVAAGQP